MSKRKILPFLLLGLCLCFSGLGLAENLYVWNTPGSPQVNSAALLGKTFYAMTNQGLYAYSLEKNQMKCLFSDSELSAKGISTDSLLCADAGLILFDVQARRIWKIENESFEKITDVDFTNAEAFQNGVRYTFPECVNGQLFAYGSTENSIPLGMLRVDLASGAAVPFSERGIIQIAKGAEGQLLAVREKKEGKETTHEIIQIDPQTASAQKIIAQVNSVYPIQISFSQSDQSIYTCLEGMLSRWDGARWETLRPMPALTGGFVSYFAVAENRTIIAKTNGITILDNAEEAEGITLVVKGLHPSISNDDAFMAKHPSISIARDIQPHFCAEEVYTEIHSQSAETDLFLVRLSGGLRNLMKKGYVQDLTDNEVLMQANQRLFPIFRQAVEMEGSLYAVPYGLTAFSWLMNNDEALGMSPPQTIQEMLMNLSAWEDHPLNTGIPYMAQTYSFEPWNRRDYADYVLKQFLMGQQDASQPISFDDACFISLLETIRSMDVDTAASATDAGSGDPTSTLPCVVAGNWLYMMHGSQYINANSIKPPALCEDQTVRIPAFLDVYIINPYSTHQQEAQWFLEDVISSLQPAEECLLYEDIWEGVMASGSVKILSELEKELEGVTARYEKAAPEWKPELEDEMRLLKERIEALLLDKSSWVVYEPLLKEYQQNIAPYVDLGLSPYLVDSVSHAAIYPQFLGIVEQYLGNAFTTEECVQKLNAMALMVFRENGPDSQ